MILFKLASRSRPERFFQTIKSITDNCKSKDYVILASLDEDDTSMNTDEVREKMLAIDNLEYVYGTSKNKVDAINRDLEKIHGWKILINVSDDMLFIKKDFDEIIREDFNVNYADFDGFIHYPDQNQGANCPTMSVMGYLWYNRFGYIYHHSYESLECDLEAMEVAKRMGRYRFLGRRLFDHIHPSFGQIDYDAQYLKTEDHAVRTRDLQNRIEREARNYDIVK